MYKKWLFDNARKMNVCEMPDKERQYAKSGNSEDTRLLRMGCNEAVFLWCIVRGFQRFKGAYLFFAHLNTT